MKPAEPALDHVRRDLRFLAGNVVRSYAEIYGLPHPSGVFRYHASYQLLKDNKVNGYDFPMLYGEVYVPYVAEGLLLRAGRFISVPDIEAQLAPNNYMYTHSMTYTFDNYTNTGL